MVELAILQEEQIKKIRNRVETGLSISRVPKETKETFIAIADADYCSDYGMLLKALLDFYINANQFEVISNKILEIDERLKKLEDRPQGPKKTVITTLSGRKIEKTEKEEKKNE